MKVLLLGGTADARGLAAGLAAAQVDAITSLAGAVQAVRRPSGQVRVGGFGGVPGLIDYLRAAEITAVIDATHPFAAQMSANAAAACARMGVPLLRLSRRSWSEHPDAADWRWVDSLSEAKAALLGRRVFLALGRKSLPDFAELSDQFVLARAIDPPAMDLPSGWKLVLARGPFELGEELELLRDNSIEVLVSKDAGGPAEAKLTAAKQLGVQVVMLRRPAEPEGVPVVTSVQGALDWLGLAAD